MITDKVTVKLFLGITSTTYDELIESYIPQVEADFLKIRGVDWDEDSNDNIEYPDNADLICAQMIGYLLATNPFNSANYGNKMSESIGSYSYSKMASSDMMSGYPKLIVSRIDRYQRAHK